MFCDKKMDVENPQRVHAFIFFGIVRLFFRKNFFIKGSPTHQYFDILKSFCYFWALDMAPTWAGPGLFHSDVTLFYDVIPVLVPCSRHVPTCKWWRERAWVRLCVRTRGSMSGRMLRTRAGPKPLCTTATAPRIWASDTSCSPRCAFFLPPEHLSPSSPPPPKKPKPPKTHHQKTHPQKTKPEPKHPQTPSNQHVNCCKRRTLFYL